MQLSTLITIIAVAILGFRSAYFVAKRAPSMSKENKKLFMLFSAILPVIWGAGIGLVLGFVAGAVAVNVLSGLVVGLLFAAIGVGTAYLRR